MEHNLDQLNVSHRRLLHWLASEPPINAVGSEISELSPEQIRAAEQLAHIGLVRVDHGWQMSVWYRITARGRFALYLMDQPLLRHSGGPRKTS